MSYRKATRTAFAFVATLTLCTSVQAAGLFRAYLASTGNDANPCTLSQPCRLLPAALTAVADGSEIWMLDSANYNTAQVNITKSVSILAVPGAVGSAITTANLQSGFCEGAIFISAPGVGVALRNLLIRDGTCPNGGGIAFSVGSELNVADCEIANVSGAISAGAPNSRVTIKNTVLRDSIIGFGAGGTVTATLDGVQGTGNLNAGVWVYTGASVTVTNSVLSGNGDGIRVETYTNSGTTRATVEHSVLTGNYNGASVVTAQGSGVSELTLSHSTVTYNGSAGISASAQNYPGYPAIATVVADGNTVTHNAIGLLFGVGGPTIYTRGNNTVKFNGMDVQGGSLTALAGM